MAKGFVYRGTERTADKIARKSSEGSRDYDSIFKAGIPIFKPKEGENCVRILPSTWEEPDWDLTIYSHYNIGPDNARYLCLAKMKNEPCPACDAKLKAADEEEADALSTSKGAICWIVDRDNEKAGPQLWSIPFTKVRNEVHTRSIDKKTRAPILVDDPEEGYDVVFNRKGTDKTTQYTGVEVVRDPSPLHDDPKVQARWLDYIQENPLPECLNFYDGEYIEKVLFGKVSSKASAKEETAEEPEAEVAPRSSRRALAKESEEEAETEASPARRRAAPASEPEAETETSASSRTARRRALLEEPTETEAETEDPPFESTSRRASREPVEEETPVAAARRSLERLKPRL